MSSSLLALYASKEVKRVRQGRSYRLYPVPYDELGYKRGGTENQARAGGVNDCRKVFLNSIDILPLVASS